MGKMSGNITQHTVDILAKLNQKTWMKTRKEAEAAVKKMTPDAVEVELKLVEKQVGQGEESYKDLLAKKQEFLNAGDIKSANLIENETIKLQNTLKKQKDYIKLIKKYQSNSGDPKIDEAKNLKNQLLNAKEGDYSKDDLEKMRAKIKQMYALLGQDVNISFKGKFETKIKNMVNAIDGFTVEWDKMNNQISQGGTPDITTDITSDLNKAEDKTQDVTSAFQELINYIGKSGKSPGGFFNKLESGAQAVDAELHKILQTLNLIDANGNIGLSSINSGYTNKGGFVSGDYAMIARPSWYSQKIQDLQPKTLAAKNAGAKIGAITDIFHDPKNGLMYEVQNRVKGNPAFSVHNGTINPDVLNASDKHIKDFVNTMQILQKQGLYVDWGGDNILYDKNEGFSIIDLGTKGDKSHTVSSKNTVDENLNRFKSQMLKYAPSSSKGAVTNLFDNMYNVAKVPTTSTASSTKKEATAHQSNAKAIQSENKALQAQAELKKKAQSMKYKDFALDESLTDLKKQTGLQTLTDIEHFWKQSNYEKDIDYKEITGKDSHDINKKIDAIIQSNISSDLTKSWYESKENFPAKSIIENEILANDELKNAAMNKLYQMYKNTGSKKTFDEFLNTKIPVYKGDGHPMIFGQDEKLSFSFSELTALGFAGGHQSNVHKTMITPKETLGNVNTGAHQGEKEVWVPSKDLPYLKGKTKSFDKYYNSLDTYEKDVLDSQLINAEKEKVKALIGKSMASAASKMATFGDDLGKQFLQGIVPDTLELGKTGIGYDYDDFANKYNNMSGMEKKLIAYYASLSQKGPGKYLDSHAIGGQKLITPIVKDPTGLQKHVNNLTGELGFNLMEPLSQDNDAGKVKASATAHDQKAQALQKEAEAQAKLNKQQILSDIEFFDEKFKPKSEMQQADFDSLFNNMQNVFQETDSTKLNDNQYINKATGAIKSAEFIAESLKDYEDAYNKQFPKTKDYLKQKFPNFDFDNFWKQMDSEAVYDKATSELADKLFETNNKAQFDHLNTIAAFIEDDINTEYDSKLLADNKFKDKANGNIVDIANLAQVIKGYEDKYGVQLTDTKDYLKQKFPNFDLDQEFKKIDDAKNMPEVDATMDEIKALAKKFEDNTVTVDVDDSASDDLQKIETQAKQTEDALDIEMHESIDDNFETIEAELEEVEAQAKETEAALEEVDDKTTPDVDDSAVKELQQIEDQAKETENALDKLDNQDVKVDIDGKTLASQKITGEYNQLSNLAKQAVAGADGFTDDVQIDKMKAMKSGLVQVEGAIKSADGAWQGFTVEIDQSNAAMVKSIGQQSAFAKALNKTKQAVKGMGGGTLGGGPLSDDPAKQAVELKKIAGIQKTLDKTFSTIDFDLIDEDLKPWQDQIAKGYEKLSIQLEQYKIDVKNGEQVELASIKATIQALQEEILMYKKRNDLLNSNSKDGSNFGATVALSEGSRFNKLTQYATDKNAGFATSKDFTAQFKQYSAAYHELIRLRNQLASKESLTDSDIKQFNEAKQACAAYGRELESAIKKSTKLKSGAEISDTLGADFVDDIDGRKQVLADFAERMYGASKSSLEFSDNFRKCTFDLDNGDGTFTKMTATLDTFGNTINSTAGSVKKYQSTFAAFKEGLKAEVFKLGKYMIASFGFEEVIQFVRQGITYVKEIDDALTDLKKVTNETDAGYDRFLQTMSKTAGVVGSTVAQLTTMAAEWARLGYNMQEAADLAESTAILLNVSEFDDATEASQALISTIQAFGYAAEDSMHVVDILNEVGNNFAISSDGIATALQDSASALMAGGNSMEEATAMIAAANKVTQDPSKVGAGLRTISLRLRGTEVSKELEAMGEDTEGLVSSSKMRSKIKGLTGVDILTDTGAYKSTYDIICEIAEVWEDMADIDQAALLELMAGKNRSNIMAALLTNLEDLEKAKKSASDAEGSAYRENEAYLDSIQGRVDLFMNALQTFWMNLISSDMAKGVVDFGTWLVKTLDTVPGKLVAITAGVSALLKVTKGFDAITAGLNMALGTNFKKSKIGTVVDTFKKGAVDIKANTVATQANTSAKAANASATNAETAADTRQAAAANTAAASNERQAAATSAAAASSTEAAAATNAETAADTRQAVAANAAAAGNEKQALAVQSTALATTEATGATTALTVATTAQAGATTAASTAFGKFKNIISKHPFAAIIVGTIAATAALDAFTKTAQEASKASHDRFNEIADVFSTTKSNIEILSEELDGADGINKRIADLEGKKLSFTENQELQRLYDQREALEKNLSIQENILEAQKKVRNEAAVNAMKDFVKASNEGAESAEKTGKVVGAMLGGVMVAGGILGTIFSGGTASGITMPTTAKGVGLIAAAVGGGAIVGGAAGGVVGSQANAATVSNYNDWYKTYTDAYEAKTKAAKDAYNKYEKDAGNMKKYDEWQKLEQEAIDIQTKMYDNLTQMQNYYSELEYGQSEALDRELDVWYNFLDKMNIDQGGAGAKANALDRIFGDNASDEVKAFKKEIDKVIKDKDNKFDIAAEIEGRKDLQELEDQLAEIGITTDEVSDYFRKTGEIGTEAFSDLSGEIAAAEGAMTKLQSVLEQNTNAGYETRNTGLEEMKDLMERGAIGSESNLWNIAEAMGFTYDSAKSIEANADALYNYIKVRDDWYQVDENGEWNISSANAFAKDIENAVKNSKELQNLKVKWDFDESTGTLDFDFNNMKFDEIVEALGKTKEAAGLTNEEFSDMLVHLGQFYDVQWTSGNDIVSYLEYLETTSLSAKSQLEAVQDPLKDLLKKQNLNPDQIEDYLTGNGSLKDLPEDLQKAVAAYRELHKEAQKDMGNAADAADTKKSGGIGSKIKETFAKRKNEEGSAGDKFGGLLSALGLSLLFGKGKKGSKNPLDGPLSKPLLLGGPAGKGASKGILGKLGAGGLGALLTKGGLKGGLGVLAKGAFKVGSKFLGPIGWAASIATTIGPMLAKQLGKGKGIGNLFGKGKGIGNVFGKGKDLFSGLFGKINLKGIGKGAGLFSTIGKGTSKLFGKGGLIGLGLGGAAMGIPWLIDKLGGKKNKGSGKGANVSADVDKGADKLASFAKSAKELSQLDDNITTNVEANVEGNVIKKFEHKIDNLKVFADSAKGLKDLGYVDVEVEANVYGNVIKKFEHKIDNLKVFAESAKGLKDLGYVDAEVEANVEGNVIKKFEHKIDNLKVFAESAKELDAIKSQTVTIEANANGNVVGSKTEFKLDNLKVFGESAKALKGVKTKTVTITANVEGNVTGVKTESKIDNLKVFGRSAKELKGVKNRNITITANVEGNVTGTKTEAKINNLATFGKSAKELKGVKDRDITIKANVEGNVTGTKTEGKIDNLKVFGQSAKELKGVKNRDITIKANLEGNVTGSKTEGKIDNLKVFADNAKELEGLKDKAITITANADGNVVNDKTEYKINNLETFGKSAKELNGLNDKTITITANAEGNVVNEKTEAKINNLEVFGKSAKELSNIESKDITITAEVGGNVVNEKTEAKINNLETFGKSAKELNGLENKTITITAEAKGNVVNEKTENKIDNLKVFGKSAQELKGVKNRNITITANVEGNVTGSKTEGKIDNLKVFAKSAKELKGVKNKAITIKAQAEGNVVNEKTENKIDNLKVFAKGAKELQDIESKTVTITAEVEGDVVESSEDALHNLKTFAKSAGELQNVKSDINVNVTTSISGKLTDEKIELLRKFSDAASTLSSIPSVVVKVTAKVATADIEGALTLLGKVKDSGLFKEYSAKVAITADTSQVTTALQTINGTTLAKKTLKISEKGSKTVLDALTKINNKKLNSKTVKVNYVTGTMPSLPAWPGGRDGNKKSPWPLVNGTAHAKGTAWAGGTAYKGGNWGAPRTETALTGELGPELLIRDGRWTTIGENGAEFTQVKKGDIIFNHRQTEELFRNGYVTSGGGRGKAYADGTAYAGGSGGYRKYSFNDSSNSVSKSGTSRSSNSSSKSSEDYSDDFEEVFDWFEVRMEEIHEDLDLMAAKLENAVGLASKNNILDSMIATNKTQLTTLEKGIKLYSSYANDLLNQIPSAYRSAAQDGKIAIEEFAGAADEKTLEAIQNYREWAQKVADLKVQLEEVKHEIAELAKQKFDNVVEEYNNKANIERRQNEKIEASIEYEETSGEIPAGLYYEEMAKNTRQEIEYLRDARDEAQKVLDDAVASGEVAVGSPQWYEMVDGLYDLDLAIADSELSLEEYQNSINDLHWERFDELISRFEDIEEESNNMIDLLGDVNGAIISPADDDYEGPDKEYWGADDVSYSAEGMAQMGLHAQQMENARRRAQEYEEQIQYLNEAYARGEYSESEYLDKLDELKDSQYDAINAYHDSRDAIIELEEARIDAIKDGIEKEIDAYSELIDKKKEELDAEKDLYDFQKSVMEQNKDIADIERQIAALSNDNSAAAVAKRKKLEAELAEANAALNETYYDRSIDQQQQGLDNELETFTKAKEAEMEALDEYLANTEEVLANSLAMVEYNAQSIGQTLNNVAKEFGLTLTEAITSPWSAAGDPIDAFKDELDAIDTDWQHDKMMQSLEAAVDIKNMNEENDAYVAATYKEPEPEPTPTPSSPSSSSSGTIKVGGKINAGSAKIYDYSGDKSGETQYFRNEPIYTVLEEKDGYLKVRWHKLSKGVTGWFKKSDVKAYAKGSKKIDKDQLALIDELGDELVLHAGQNGRLEYLSKGSGVVPADLTSNLMDWGELNPQDILDRSRPSIGAHPEVHATEINLNIKYGDMLKIENFKGDNPDEIAKIVAKQFEKHTKDLNSALRKYVR